jgi:hypothetical protein
MYNSNFSPQVYAGEVHVASARAGFVGWVVAINWLLFPLALQTVMHPIDALRAQYRLQGQDLPHFFTTQQIVMGCIEAMIALGVIVLLTLVCTVLFYRRAKIEGAYIATPALWPLAAFTAGILGNGAWWYGTGAFDLGGALVGMASAALTVGGELMCNKLGREFVFGPTTEFPQPAALYHFPNGD